MPQRTKIQSILIIGAGVAFLSTSLFAETRKHEPLVTKSKIEEVAVQCNAEITVSETPDYDDETGAVAAKAILMVEIQRSNSPEAIACVKDLIPTVFTALVGREKGVPPLDQAILDDVLKRCDWREKDGFVGFVDGDELRFQPNPSADYDRVDCALKGLKPHAPKFGFVGNEQYRTEEEQK